MNLKTTIIRLAVILAILSLLILSLPAPVLAASIGISVVSGPPGTTISVSGSGFTSGESYQIIFAPGTAFQTTLLPSTLLSGTTSFSTTVTIPSAPFAEYEIRVSATTSGDTSVNFNLTAGIALNASSGFTGDILLVSGAGFRAGVPVFVYFNNVNSANTTANSNGVMSPVSIQVPTIRAATYNVHATDGSATASPVVFTVRPRLRADISQGAVGSQVELEGSGFDYKSGISFQWDNDTLITPPLFSNSTGLFLTNVIIPPAARGSHTIKVRDNSLHFASVNFEVTPSLTLSPTSTGPASTVTLTGRGFRASNPVSITFNGTQIATQPATIFTDSTGSLTASFVVPGILAGSYIVSASDGSVSATAALAVASSITLTPASGNVGSGVTVTGTGFSASGNITLSYDTQTLKTLTADSTGAFSTGFTVPTSSGGQHTVTTREAGVAVAATATFTMESVPPPAPALLAPAADSQADVQPSFSWTVSADPSGVNYELQIARDTGFSQLVLSKTGLAQNSYQPSQAEKLEPAKKTSSYYWRVRAIDAAGNASDWASPVPFYTQDSTPPDQPAALGPATDSLADQQPTFSWSVVTDSGSITYELQIARDTGFSQLVLSKTGLAQNSYQLSQTEKLEPAKKTSSYYWRVRAIDGAGNAQDWTSPISFHTQDSAPPPLPVLLSPANGARSGSTPLLNWSDVSDPQGVSYSIQVARDAGFSQIVLTKDNLTKSEYKLNRAEKLPVSPGNPPNPYFWMVRATDGAQNQSDWTVPSAFYVGGVFQGALLYAVVSLSGLLLLVIGIFIGMRIRPAAKPGASPPAA